MNRRRIRRINRRAAMLVLIAVCLPLCIIMAAFAIDVAWMQLVRTELRTSTDAAARAAAKELSLSQDTTTVARPRRRMRPSATWWPATRCCWPTATSNSATASQSDDVAIQLHARCGQAERGACHRPADERFAWRAGGFDCSPACSACGNSSRRNRPLRRSSIAIFAWWSIDRAR